MFILYEVLLFALSYTTSTNLPLNDWLGLNFLEIIISFFESYSKSIQLLLIFPSYLLIPDRSSLILILIWFEFIFSGVISGPIVSFKMVYFDKLIVLKLILLSLFHFPPIKLLSFFKIS